MIDEGRHGDSGDTRGGMWRHSRVRVNYRISHYRQKPAENCGGDATRQRESGAQTRHGARQVLAPGSRNIETSLFPLKHMETPLSPRIRWIHSFPQKHWIRAFPPRNTVRRPFSSENMEIPFSPFACRSYLINNVKNNVFKSSFLFGFEFLMVCWLQVIEQWRKGCSSVPRL